MSTSKVTIDHCASIVEGPAQAKWIASAPDQMRALLEDLYARALRGEVRVYKCDGTWEDVVVGGTEEERAEAAAELRRMYDQPH